MEIEEVREFVGESGGLEVNGLDDCIIGVAERCSKPPLLVYDTEKIIEKFMKVEGMSHEEAQEFFSFNIGGAWMGEGTPLFMTKVESFAGKA